MHSLTRPSLAGAQEHAALSEVGEQPSRAAEHGVVERVTARCACRAEGLRQWKALEEAREDERRQRRQIEIARAVLRVAVDEDTGNGWVSLGDDPATEAFAAALPLALREAG